MPTTSALAVIGKAPKTGVVVPFFNHKLLSTRHLCIRLSLRRSAKYIAIACSATDSLDAAGTFDIVMLFAVHAGISILIDVRLCFVNYGDECGGMRCLS